MSTIHTPAQLQALQDLQETHAEVLQQLLGPYYQLPPLEIRQYGPLTKYTLGRMPDGRWAHLHYLERPDEGAPHCHPVDFTSHVIKGSYVERIWHLRQGEYKVEHVLREPGQTPHLISAERIHSIVALPQGECWTLVFSGPVIRQWQHYPELHNPAMPVPLFAST